MHYLTSLGATLHVKELDRQASPQLRPLRAMRQDGSPVTRVRTTMIAVLRQLHAAGIPGRVASHRQGRS